MKMVFRKIGHFLIILGVIISVFFSVQFLEGGSSGDLNFDGRVDVLDLNLLHLSLLSDSSKGDSVKDQNGDGKLDIVDLQILLNRLGRKWQEKGARYPYQKAVVTSSKEFRQNSKENVATYRFEMERVLRYGERGESFVFGDREQIPPREIYFLSGFLCHAPPCA